MKNLLLMSIVILLICFVAVFLTLPSKKITCEKIDKSYCNNDNECVCEKSPCLGVVNKNYSVCEKIRQNLIGTIETCTDICPPMRRISNMQWEPLCLNNKCTNAYVNESFICIEPNNCTKR